MSQDSTPLTLMPVGYADIIASTDFLEVSGTRPRLGTGVVSLAEWFRAVSEVVPFAKEIIGVTEGTLSNGMTAHCGCVRIYRYGDARHTEDWRPCADHAQQFPAWTCHWRDIAPPWEAAMLQRRGTLLLKPHFRELQPGDTLRWEKELLLVQSSPQPSPEGYQVVVTNLHPATIRGMLCPIGKEGVLPPDAEVRWLNRPGERYPVPSRPEPVGHRAR